MRYAQERAGSPKSEHISRLYLVLLRGQVENEHRVSRNFMVPGITTRIPIFPFLTTHLHAPANKRFTFSSKYIYLYIHIWTKRHPSRILFFPDPFSFYFVIVVVTYLLFLRFSRIVDRWHKNSHFLIEKERKLGRIPSDWKKFISRKGCRNKCNDTMETRWNK